MATYVNDLRLKEIATGDESGTWGTSTNTNLELIAEAFSFGTEAITTNADTHTTTIADGSTDPGRSIYLKYTGTLDSACTITIGPNTVSKLWFIENGTSGSQNIIISQGSGANVTIPAGDVKAVYSDGAGSGAAIVDAFASLNVVDLKVEDDLTVTDDATVGGTLGVTGVLTANAGVVVDNITIDGNEIDVSSGDLTLDVAGDIILDAAGSDFQFNIGGTNLLNISNASLSTEITQQQQDTDIRFKGNDGGTTITALTLDISDAGTAVFNNKVGVSNVSSPNANLHVGSDNATGDATNPAIQIGGTSTYRMGMYTSAEAAVIENKNGDDGIQFRVKTLGEAVRINGTNGFTGFGETSPDSIIHVTGTNNSAGDLYTEVGRGNVPSITLQNAGTTDNNNAAIFFDNDNTTGASIGARFVDHSDEETQLRFSTHDGSSVKERIFIDGSGNFGINMIPAPVGNDKVFSIFESNTPRIKLHNSTTGTAGTDGGELNMTSSDFIIENRESGNLRLFTNGSERARFTSGGKLFLGTTSAVRGSEDLSIQASSDAIVTRTASAGLIVRKTSFSNGFMCLFENDSATQVGAITSGGSSTVFNTSSDYRLKENIEPMQNGLERLNHLNPVKFTWKETGEESEGFIAHEVDEVFSDCIHGEKDGENMQGMDYGRITPLLVKAIQELSTTVDQLKAEITTLKGE